MGISARTLFHFTKKRENLESILENSFYPNYSIEDLSNAIPADKVYIALIPMVSFCDLIFPQIKEHINFYGEYGIGLRKKEWGIKMGISPIVYIPNESKTSKFIRLITKQLRNFLKNKDDRILHKHLPDFYKYIKHYEGLVLNRTTKKMENRIFYDEREWRYVPDEFPVLPENYSKKLLAAQNRELINKRSLKFKAEDIKYIIIKDEKEIPSFVDFIEKRLTKVFNDSERKIIVSKLISVPQIKDDMSF